MAPRISLADYLHGYVVGYWEGFDFAQSAEGRSEGRNEEGSATGDADATSAAPSTTGRSAPTGLEQRRPVADSAAEALPAIRQTALPDEVEVVGELEALHHHRGMVEGLRRMQWWLARLGHHEAAQLCANAAVSWGTPEDRADES